MRCDRPQGSPGGRAPGAAKRRGSGRFLRSAASVLLAVTVAAFAAPVLLSPPADAQGYDPMRPSTSAAPARPGYDPMQRGGAGEPSGPPAEGNPELGGLPDGPGAEETYYLCSACHSIRMVTQQRITDARWDYLWDWMIREQNMPEQDAETRETILGYLKTHFSSER